MNSQNSCLWSLEKLRALHQTPFDDQKAGGAWTVISRRQIFCSNFFHQAINLGRHCEGILCLFMAQLDENEVDKAYFKQNGTTAHTASKSMKLMDEGSRERNF
jgi:hypothetical protein